MTRRLVITEEAWNALDQMSERLGKNSSNTILKLIEVYEKPFREPSHDWLSQALNEGDGVYRP